MSDVSLVTHPTHDEQNSAILHQISLEQVVDDEAGSQGVEGGEDVCVSGQS